MKQLLTVLLILSTLSLSAQSSRSYARIADSYARQGRMYEAGVNYERAYQLKKRKTKRAFQAAESYAADKAFDRAAKMYDVVKDDTKKYPLVRFKYAQALKQSGQFDDAAREFIYFMNTYKGVDAEELFQIASTERLGCEFAIASEAHPMPFMKIDHVGGAVNTSSFEFAPMPVGEQSLYFSSTRNGSSKLYRSLLGPTGWQEAIEPENFVTLTEKHFGSGSLTEDMDRFYFTQCASTSGLLPTCALYVTNKTDENGWDTPTLLPEYINIKGATVMHPNVINYKGKEVIFFASDRPGGHGSLDIWYMEIDPSSPAMDYSYPVNLGSEVNTHADEITPFYDLSEKALYFSSKGHVSIGGHDIFKTLGFKDNWTAPENPGMPLNSTADDYYFTKRKGAESGYFVSNRKFGMEKLSTDHEDIFTFYFTPNQYILEGLAMNDFLNPIQQAEVTLYEVGSNKDLSLLTSKSIEKGTFQFPILPNKNYILEVEADGFPMQSFPLSTYGKKLEAQTNMDLHLSKSVAEIANTSAVTFPSSVGATTSSNEPNPNGKLEDKLLPAGTYYKVQLKSGIDADLNHPSYQMIDSFGTLEKENTKTKEGYRILLGDYFNFESAIANLARVKNRGFQNAFIVKYKNGERVGVGK